MLYNPAVLSQLKSLGRETLIYGLSTVAARLLNFLLIPFYTHILPPSEYGLVAVLFAGLAFLNIFYNYGMDFAFMRHSGSEEESRKLCFSTSFWSLLASSLLFSILIVSRAGWLAEAAGLSSAGENLVRAAAWILALDALALVPFAALRLEHKAARYVSIKTANIAANLILNYVFLARMGLGVRGVFLASLGASALTLALLLPVLAKNLRPCFDPTLYRSLLAFGLPLLPAGFASMAVQVIDRPILKALTDDATVGIYQANYRLGILMMMVVNMFDAAWRPFFLQQAGEPDSGRMFARILTYFTLASSFLVLGLSLFIPTLVSLPIFFGKPLIHPDYWGGLGIVPVILLAYLFNGMYVNFLAPVALAKRSRFVAYAGGLGAVVNIAANFCLIPRWPLMGAALATLAAYLAMAAALFVLGRRVYPIPYEYRRLAHIAVVLGGLGAAAWFLPARGAVLPRLGLCAALPLLLWAGGFFNDEERRAVRKILQRQNL